MPESNKRNSRHNCIFLNLLLFLAIGLTTPLTAQKYLIDVEHINTEDGLANLMTTSIYKDSKGFIWASTKYGLNRYDGYHFKLYTKEENGLRSNDDITKIQEDEDGFLWIYHFNNKGIDVDIFDPKTERAIPFDDFFSERTLIKEADIYYAGFNVIRVSKVKDPENRTWVVTKKGQLFLYENKTFTKYFEQEDLLIQRVIWDQNNNMWVSSEEKLIHFDSSGREIERFNLEHKILELWLDADDTLWLTTLQIEDLRVKTHIFSKSKLDLSFQPFILNGKGELSGEIRYAIRDRHGLWYANDGKHLHLFNQAGEWIFNYRELNKNAETDIRSYFDADNLMWFTTPIGILKTSVKPNPFHLIHSRPTTSDCRNVVEDEAGNIYFLNSGVYSWDPKDQSVKKVTNSKGALGLIYTDSSLWIGYYGVRGNLGFKLDLKTKEESSFKYSNGILIHFLLNSKQPDLLLAGTNTGLGYIDLRNQKYFPFNKLNGFEALKTSNIYYLFENSRGIWAATDVGIFLIDEEKGVLQHFDQASGDLPFNHIRHIYEDRDGIFWLATKGGGIIQWQPDLDGKKNAQFQQFTTENGLSNNYTYAVYDDDFGYLWIPSDKGLMQMNKSNFEVKTFLVEDGLPHNEFNQLSHYKAKDGTLYFGGLGGLISFHPKDFSNELENASDLQFTELYLLENNEDELTNKTKLHNYEDEFIIQPSDKFFEIHFALLDYDFPKKHRYAYKIDGYSSRWNYIDENFIRITNLPYGKYTINIRGQNSSKGWSSQQLNLRLLVKKPFYLQWWFIASLVFAVSGLIIAGVLWQIFNLRRDRERLEAEVQKRTLTIQQQSEELITLDKAKTRFFSNITHEFRTPLTLIIGPLEQVIKEPPPPKIYRRRLNGILNNAHHLLNLINQLLDLSKMENGEMKVNLMRGDLIAYTKELIKRFQFLAFKKDQQLNFICDQNSWKTNFDKNVWDRIVYNLLYNAIKFTPTGNAIQLSLSSLQKDNTDFIRLDVKDSGIGMEESQLNRIFDRFYQVESSSTRSQGGTGIGLALVKELVDLQGGAIQVSSAPNKGSSFEVLLPVSLEVPVQSLENKEFSKQSDYIPIESSPALTPANVVSSKEGKLEVLIIEDNEEMREYIQYCLDASKYNVSEAVDGVEGIEKAQTIIPDLIVSDVMMPRKNGFQVTQTIRANISTSHIPIILLSAKASMESRLKGFERGADAYLTKPFSPQELALRIQKLIEIRNLLQQRYKSGKEPKQNQAFQPEDEFIINLRAYVLAHIDKSNLNGDHIGKQFGMSRIHLYRKLKALTNQSISEFVRDIRLKKAFELIQQNELNVAEITYQTGFSSPEHFSRTFKKAYGKAPSQM